MVEDERQRVVFMRSEGVQAALASVAVARSHVSGLARNLFGASLPAMVATCQRFAARWRLILG